MTIIKHELRQGFRALLIWALGIGALISISILLFPEMKGQMAQAGDLFASMGSFSAAFGMDKLDFGAFKGYFAVECANVLGLGGAFFAAVSATNSLSKEEGERTAEFLFTHPVTRLSVVRSKLCALVIRIAALNLMVFAFSLLSTVLIGEEVPWKEFFLMHAAFFLMQLELAGICFGVSAFIVRGGAGIGLGLAVLMYFLNIISNITDSVRFLKYITPFGYCDASDIVTSGALDGAKIALGAAFATLGIAAAFLRYTRKDIRA